MTVALVCGGRNYGRVPFGCPMDQERRYAAKASREIFILRETLDHLRNDRDMTAIINGGASGADQHAHSWAEFRRIPSTKIKAEWKRYGRAAGPIRNGRMLELKPDFIVAFTGGDGTADMIRQAVAAGVEVLDYRENAP
jgi:hypothetical protein